MRIFFICGALESGRDGVGDYTRRLAGELSRMGHGVAIVGINDPFVTNELSEVQDADGVGIPVLRIPSAFDADKRFKFLEKEIGLFAPDWISLQFVPFSFHPKGLSLSFSAMLKQLVADYRFHIMFHELWVGINGRVKLKMAVLGIAQKILIHRLLRQLKPDVITTSTTIYKRELARFPVEILPLFSNVPLAKSNSCSEKDSVHFRAVHFGTFSAATAEFKLQIEFLTDAAQLANKELELLVFGEGGPFKNNALDAAKELIGADNVVDLGRLSFQDISCNLRAADVGISRANYAFFGKSGSTLAMIEHGLPVILRGKNSDVDPKELAANRNQLFFFDCEAHGVLEKFPMRDGLKESAEIFTKMLNQV